MNCPACDRDNPEDAAFCRGCGAPVRTEIACPGCGQTNLLDSAFCTACGQRLGGAPPPRPLPPLVPQAASSPTGPVSFAQGRYHVSRLLGEGGKKRVYLAHDTRLGRDVAFALIKTDGLDAAGHVRLDREARAMAQLGDHPHIVSVLDLGEELSTGSVAGGQPYLVSQLMAGGDLETLLDQAPEHRLPLGQAVTIARQVTEALVHAHAHGVIHRDLKPGNIWLTGEGTAKLGDFGLAVALDQSRLTQPGMMVGTVSYMAPEQAIGGTVDVRSDLYALGALLYEMVCGRPPFVGDESVAIITQHLNTPPVTPSWHRPECPPGLESLILRLLEKDPAKRPSSASEVIQALTGMEADHGGTTGRSPAPASTSAIESSPLYRRAFVGRESELRQLQAIFDAALSGRGGLVMVVGEPGIGKTSLCEQLATYVTVRGGTALIGHCYEEGSLSLPYL
ncbi:MAG: protein kinase domain-containing protein, partial [Chloroflexota bacterium]